jgi:hypothetical protein
LSLSIYLIDTLTDKLFFFPPFCVHMAHGGPPIPLGKLSLNDLFSSLLCDDRMVGSVKKK